MFFYFLIFVKFVYSKKAPISKTFKSYRVFKMGELQYFEQPKKKENFRILAPTPFNIPHHSQFCRFSYFSFDMNEFRRFIFLVFISTSNDFRKLRHSTFKHSLIFKFEMSSILKFHSSKF